MKQVNAVYAFSIALVFSIPEAGAEVFKCVDSAGKITYSQKTEPNAQCSVVTGEINVVPATRAAAPPKSVESSERERVSKSDPQGGQIAEQERALAEAKKALAEQESIRLGGERNYQRVLDRLQPFQDKVAEIEKKLAQLREAQSKAK